ncbi:polysaccharide biosynthesis protein [Vagococcus sp. BWB3-3]|uniref:Polysaccharide biosynthesis protein n=1 Tax=Vagococcus allomyrinae TaxID=2794353 RepID=A0A940PBU2_9ENTE|nr:polysaccharide biosynthesis protein [Vagococcus allomyrinae]MBP1042099.1 polysaccharide biosynthesis protein [Vagococcus allomyrinae]
MKKKLVIGTFWLSFANMFSKILGIIYIIPWLAMMGSQQEGLEAQALYNVAYVPYALFLTLGTAGFPSAIAKQVAEYNGKNNFRTSLNVLKVSGLLMTATGIVSAVLMYLLAPLLAQISPVSNTEDAIMCIRSLCPSLALIPVLSVFRGFFQGNNELKPFSLSQILEQFGRVVFILGFTYFVLQVNQGKIAEAVKLSTFASFIGGLLALVYLLVYAYQRRQFFQQKISDSLPALPVSVKQLLFSIIKESIPFVIIGSAITLAQLIDQLMLKEILVAKGGITPKDIEFLFSQSSANPNKLTALVIALAASVGSASLPLIAEIGKRDRAELERAVADSLRMTLMMLLPMAVGLMVLAQPAYRLIFGVDSQGGNYLVMAVFAAVAFSLFAAVFTIIQSLGEHRLALSYFGFGLLAKVLLQIPCIYFFEGYGANLASTLSFSLITFLAYKRLTDKYQIRPLYYVRSNVGRVLGGSLIMGGVCYLAGRMLQPYVDLNSWLASLLYAIIIAAIGVLVYGLIVFRKTAKHYYLAFKNK